MSLSSIQRKKLKRKGHVLKPRIKIGKSGLGVESIKILNKLLNDLSLIKIKILGDKAARSLTLDRINELRLGEVVGTIGSSVILYKKNHLNLLGDKSLEDESLEDESLIEEDISE